MKNYHIIYLIGIVFLLGACAEEDSIGMPDYEVDVIASADIAENKYFFNAHNLQGTEIEFDLNYNGFDIHEAQSIELYVSKSPETVTVGTFNSFPSTVTMTAEEAYGYFGQTLEDFDDDGSDRDEFQSTYTLTTTDGTEYSQFGQFYTYNPSLDGRFT